MTNHFNDQESKLMTFFSEFRKHETILPFNGQSLDINCRNECFIDVCIILSFANILLWIKIQKHIESSVNLGTRKEVEISNIYSEYMNTFSVFLPTFGNSADDI